MLIKGDWVHSGSDYVHGHSTATYSWNLYLSTNKDGYHGGWVVHVSIGQNEKYFQPSSWEWKNDKSYWSVYISEKEPNNKDNECVYDSDNGSRWGYEDVQFATREEALEDAQKRLNELDFPYTLSFD